MCASIIVSGGPTTGSSAVAKQTDKRRGSNTITDRYKIDIGFFFAITLEITRDGRKTCKQTKIRDSRPYGHPPFSVRWEVFGETISKAVGYQYDSIQSSPIGAIRSTVHPASRIVNIMLSAAGAFVE
ncbi:hypothetical protein Enr13x_71840 [Stieleria neptunia]|uniref:Uncharacterized protein n=1 Tax=Stieleria neptunia TaxID=2527979 RepID=A0A518I2D5_9BACT|nr:hypothetical protein Enr13x_71840 [Stieleria neptunia]